MKITQQPQQKEYPYLAIMTFGDPIKQHKVYPIEDIVLISMISENDEDAKPYVQYVNGSKQGWFTNEEESYAALPKGYKITLKQ